MTAVVKTNNRIYSFSKIFTFWYGAELRNATSQVVHKVGKHKRACGSSTAFVVRRRQVLFHPNPHFHLSLIPFITTLLHRLARLNTLEIIILWTHPDMIFLCPPFHNSDILGKLWVASATHRSEQSADEQLSIKVLALLHPPAVDFTTYFLFCLLVCLFVCLFFCFNNIVRALLSASTSSRLPQPFFPLVCLVFFCLFVWYFVSLFGGIPNI